MPACWMTLPIASAICPAPICRSCCAGPLRNAGSIARNDQVEEAIDSIADELGRTRNDMIRYIIKE